MEAAYIDATLGAARKPDNGLNSIGRLDVTSMTLSSGWKRTDSRRDPRKGNGDELTRPLGKSLELRQGKWTLRGRHY